MTTPTATIFAPWHALDELIQRGTRAAQPAATAVVPGTLYCVTDEPLRVERSNGAAWEVYTRRRHGQIFLYDFSTTTTEPPIASQIRINAAYPYASATKIWIRHLGNDGRDLYWALVTIDTDTLVLIQDKNDHTIYAQFRVTGPAVEKTGYVEWPVVWDTGGGAPLFNAQSVMLLKR